jgi:hypothetical protein
MILEGGDFSQSYNMMIGFRLSNVAFATIHANSVADAKHMRPRFAANKQQLIPEPNPEGNHEAPVAQVPIQPNKDEFAPEEAGDEDDDAQSLPEGAGVPTNELLSLLLPLS